MSMLIYIEIFFLNGNILLNLTRIFGLIGTKINLEIINCKK